MKKKITIRHSYNNVPDDLVALISFVQLIIGVLFLLPPILGVVLFTLNVFGLDGYIDSLDYLSINWTGGDNAMSAAPIYLGLMAIAGAFMVHSAVKNVISATQENIGQINEIEVDDNKKE